MRLTWMCHVVHKTCTMHGKDIKTRYIGSTSILLVRKDWHSVRLDRMQSSFKIHSLIIVFQKILDWKLVKSYTKKYTCPLDLCQRSHWSTNGKENWRPEGGGARRANVFQPTQSTPNPSRDRSGRLDNMQDGRNTYISQEIDVNSFCEELSSSDITGRPVETEVNLTRSSEDSRSLNVELTHYRTGWPVANTAAVQDDSQVYHEAGTPNIDDETLRERIEKSIVVHNENHEPMMVNEADMDFGIQGLPHSVVKQAQSTSVRPLILKIDTHPNRHALQQDLRQNQSFIPFSPESKQMIQDVGNIELYELPETEPKTQRTVCLSYWNTGIVHCTCGYSLAYRKRGESEIHQVYVGPSFNSGLRHQERTTPRTSTWLEVGRQRTVYGQPVEEELHEEVLPGHPYLLCSNWNIKKKELAEINYVHIVLLLHGGVGKVLGGLLIPLWKSPWRWTKYW